MTRSTNLVGAMDYGCFEDLAEYAKLGLSYWVSGRDASLRSKQRTVEVRYRQIAAGMREAFGIAKMLGAVSDKAAA
jgi:hypothetical protein